MTSADLRAIRRLLGLTQTALGEAVGKSRATVERWERATYPIPKLVAAEINRLLIRRRTT